MTADKPDAAPQPIERWPLKGTYGGSDALQAMGTVAAPLLAGFSLTISTLVLTSARQIRWSGLTLVLATVATIAMVSSLQFSFWARQWVVTPEDMRRWWDDTEQAVGRHEAVKEMRAFAEVFEVYSTRSRIAYNIGITSLLLGFAVALVPPDGASQPPLRWTSATVAACAGLLEIVWALFGKNRIRESTHLPALVKGLAQWLVLTPDSKRFHSEKAGTNDGIDQA